MKKTILFAVIMLMLTSFSFCKESQSKLGMGVVAYANNGQTPLYAQKEKWRMLTKGMSESKVRNILGEPERIEAPVSSWIVWYYPNLGQVRFDNNFSGPFLLSTWSEPRWENPNPTLDDLIPVSAKPGFMETVGPIVAIVGLVILALAILAIVVSVAVIIVKFAINYGKKK